MNNMLRNFRNTRRLFSIARILAQEDALFLIDDLEISPVLSIVCRVFTSK